MSAFRAAGATNSPLATIDQSTVEPITRAKGAPAVRPSLTTATFVALAATACAWFASPAHADQTAADTIAQLQSQGYQVNVDRVGSRPLDECVVTSVRNPQTQTTTIRDYYGKPDEHGNRKYRLVEVVTSRSISVSLDCS
jgi:hypothetical protein